MSSIEQIIKENTEALKALTQILKDNSNSLKKNSEEPPAPIEKAKPAVEVEEKPTNSETIDTSEKVETPTEEEEEAPAIDYDTIKQTTLSFLKEHGREELIKILNEFDAKSAKDLKAEQYASYIERLTTAG